MAPGSTPGQAPFSAFFEIPISQSNNKNRKIKLENKNKIFVKQAFKHTSHTRNFSTKLCRTSDLTPASLITERLRENSTETIAFTQWSMRCKLNELKKDG